MKGSAKSILKNYTYSLISNAVVFLISSLVVAVVPKIIGAAEYGYFTFYILISAYVGFFHFGWCDGIYLKYGGAYYDKLDKKRMSAQFWMLSAFEVVMTLLLLLVIRLTSPSADDRFVEVVTVLSIILVIPKTMLIYVLQLTNRIREYSIVNVVEKIVYCLLVIVLLLAGSRDYRPLLYADLAGKAASLALGVFYCRDIVFSKCEAFRSALREAGDNIRVGVNLMVANVAGQLILGIVRVAIKDHWSIEVFGKISLSLSVSSLLMVLVSAVGTVLFPMLKRIDSGRLQELYGRLRDSLMVPIFAMLLLFYPLRAILSVWLPQYAESFRYMALLFPVCVFDSKMSMLINTYMKALRMERKLLLVNLATMLLSAVLTAVTIYWLNSLELAVLSILLLFAFRCTLCEYDLSRAVGTDITRDVLLESGMIAVFVAATWFLRSGIACLIYAAAYAGYLLAKKKDIAVLRGAIRKDVFGKGN